MLHLENVGSCSTDLSVQSDIGIDEIILQIISLAVQLHSLCYCSLFFPSIIKFLLALYIELAETPAKVLRMKEK